jgi:signal transduction histidine kinase
MANLVDELLLLARSDEGQLAPATSPADVLAVARTVAASICCHTGSPEVTVSGTSALVLVPPAYLERMISNLVENARRFAVSRVEVRVGASRGTVTLEVRDDGPGVPLADRGRIFERFVRLDEARDREHGGFGLGLAIVADLCHAYGGTIEVGDAHPGSLFSIRLPLARDAGRRPPSSAATPDALEPSHS